MKMGFNSTDFHRSNGSNAEDRFYGDLIHATRCSLSLLAIVFNAFFIFLFASHACLRANKINWAVCSLMLSNILLCGMLAIYSLIKLIDAEMPDSLSGCLTLNWFMVVVSFGPTWSITIMTSLRTLSFCSPKQMSERMTLKKLIIIRCIMFVCDIIMATLIISDVSQSKLNLDSQCAYQNMLDNSLFYVVYNLLVGLVLLISGLTSLISRTYHRSRILRSMQLNVIETGSGTKSESESEQQVVVPSVLWRKPKFLVLFAILAVLFCYPRIAFVIKDNRIFWQTATLCPPAIALLFACAFCTIPKDFRSVSRKCLLNALNAPWIKRTLCNKAEA